MRSSRFVTLCFLYSGVVLLATQVAIYEPDLVVVTVANTGAALSILFTGLYRLHSEGEGKPEEYGLFAYGMAALSVLITLSFLVSLWLL